MTHWPHVHTEWIGPGRTLLLKLKEPWLFDEEEQFSSLGDTKARIQIGDFEELGRGLCIDGTVQLTEAADPVYTTALVFPAALLAGARRRWLILGGGDGATPREALRFRDTESVRLCDISRVVMERTQALIPSFWAGCQRDPRLEIVNADAGEVLRDMASRGEQVDVLVYDLSDAGTAECNPSWSSPADHLYTEEVFALAARCLRPGGVFVAQLDELSPLWFELHRRRRQTLKKVFRHVHSYRTFIESFGYVASFALASNHQGPWDPSRAKGVEERLAELYSESFADIYSGAWHEHLFTLPPSLVRGLDK